MMERSETEGTAGPLARGPGPETHADRLRVDGPETTAASGTLVHNWDEALNAIDGKAYVLDGVHGVFKVDRTRQYRTRVFHEPSEQGRNSEVYLKWKERFRDDWSSDLSDSERLPAIMEEMGIHF